MTNLVSNSVVVIDTSTNGGATAVMVNLAPVMTGLLLVVMVIVGVALLVSWLRKLN